MKRFQNFFTILLTSSTLLTVAQTALGSSCNIIHRPDTLAVPAADLATQVTQNYSAENIEAYKLIETTKTQLAGLNQEANQPMLNALREVLVDEELSAFHMTIRKTFAGLAQFQPANAAEAGAVRASLIQSLTAELSKFMSPAQAQERAQLLESATLTKADMMRALGQMSASESLVALVGAEGIQNVSADSLVGRFLTEAQAMGINPSKLVSSFARTNDGTERGEERLFVSVDARLAPLVNKYFGNNPHLLSHGHTRGQGTLHLNFLGKDVSYTRFGGEHTMGFGVDTIVPYIVLSTTEGSRVKNYFDLGNLTNQARSKYPWSLVKIDETNQETPYCRTGGYSSCTHWFGEMAFGDRLVDQYSFPGNADQYACTTDPQVTDQRALRTGAVGQITHFKQGGATPTPIGTETRIDRLTRMVWRDGQGNEQMWSVLGTPWALEDGSLANPGWVLYTLLGSSRASRVPVVFVYRQDATAPLDQTAIDALKTTISQY